MDEVLLQSLKHALERIEAKVEELAEWVEEQDNS